MGRTKAEGTLVKRGNCWHLVLMIDGKRHWRAIKSGALKTVTRREDAEALRAATAAAIRQDAAGPRSESVPVDQIEVCYVQHLPTYSKRRGRPHVDSAREVPIAPRTLATNRHYAKAFASWLAAEHAKVMSVEAITKVHASGFMATLGGLLPSSYNRALMALRHVFDVLPYGVNPFRELPQKTKTVVDQAATGRSVFTVEQLATMQARATGWVRPAMFIGYHSGLRLGDVVTLKWSEIDQEGYIKHTQRKSSKDETIYCPEMLSELGRWKREQGTDAGEYLFPYQAAAYLGIGRTVDQTLPGKQFQRFLSKTCQFQTRDANGGVVLGFHSLRASNATYGRRAGMTATEVQKRLAHSSAATTSGYIQLSDDDIRPELRATHKPLVLPGPSPQSPAEPAASSEAADRERLAQVVRTTMPIAEVRRLLAGVAVED